MKGATDAIDSVLNKPYHRVVKKILAGRFTVPELLNAPLFLLRVRLQLSSESSTLDLSRVEMGGEPNAWRACIHRLLSECSGMEFETIRAPNFLGEFPGTTEALEMYSRFRAYAAWSTQMPHVKGINFHPCQCSPPPSTKHIDANNGPCYAPCKCMPLLPDIKFVCHALTQLPNLQAVTLPSFFAPQIQYHKFQHTRLDPSDFCSRRDVLQLIIALTALPSLQSLVVQQLPQEAYLHELVQGISVSAGMQEQLTRLQLEHSISGNKLSISGNKRSRAGLSIDAVLSFRNLRHLVVPLSPSVNTTGVKQSADADIRQCLVALTALSALTFLRVDYCATSDEPVLSQRVVGEFLAGVARELKPLSLKVLHIMCPRFHCVPKAKDETTVSESRLEEFRVFAQGLDEVIIRGLGCDLIFGVNGSMEGNSVPALSSLDWVDSSDAKLSVVRDPARLDNLSHLSHLTELHLTLKCKVLTTTCIKNLANSVGSLLHLRKIKVSRDFSTAPRVGKLLSGIVSLIGLEDLEYVGVQNCGWESLAQSAIFKKQQLGMAASLTRLVLHNITKKDYPYITPVLCQLTALRCFRTPASAPFQREGLRDCNFLACMLGLREIEVSVKMVRGSKNCDLEHVGVLIGHLTELTYMRLGLLSVLAEAARGFAQHLTSLCSLRCLDVHLNLNEVSASEKAEDEEDRILGAVYSKVAGTKVPVSDLLEATERVKSGAKAKERRKKGGGRK